MRGGHGRLLRYATAIVTADTAIPQATTMNEGSPTATSSGMGVRRCVLGATGRKRIPREGVGRG